MQRDIWLLLLIIAPVSNAILAAPPPGYFMSLAVYTPSTNHISALTDLGTSTYALNGTYGQAGDIPVVGDFDGNGVYDIAVFRSGAWYADTRHTLALTAYHSYGGTAGDVPLAADFDGDGISDLVIYNSGTWYIRNSKTATQTIMSLGGAAGDIPVVADFDGDGIPDIAIFNAGTWTIRKSSTGTNITDTFGDGTYKPCAADWDHDGRAELCIFRNGVWSFKSVGAAGVLDTYTFGASGDIPLAGGAFDTNAIFVRAGASGTQNGSLSNPYTTVSAAINAAANGSVVRVAGGTYTESLNIGKNNLKLLGVTRRAANLAPGSNNAMTLAGATGIVIENFNVTSAASNGIVLCDPSCGSSLPGSSATISFNSITGMASYGILLAGQSQATITHNIITGSVNYSGIGLQNGPAGNPTRATIAYNEIANNGPESAPVDCSHGGNGIEAIASTIVSVVGNNIHNNGRFGIGAAVDAKLTIDSNEIRTNTCNGIMLCGGNPGYNDTSSAVITGNTISGNGTAGNQNGLEIDQTCTGTQTVNGNTFGDNISGGNSVNGIYIGGGTLNAANNTFSNNDNGMTIQSSDNSSANTIVSLFGNSFTNNSQVGIYAQWDPGTTAHDMVVNVGGIQSGQQNYFSGQGFAAIGCLSSPAPLLINCPAGANTFATAIDNVESNCSCDDVFHDGFGP